jgi:hypothetical protein
MTIEGSATQPASEIAPAPPLAHDRTAATISRQNPQAAVRARISQAVLAAAVRELRTRRRTEEPRA